MVNELKKLKIGKILENVDLKNYTTYKVGGDALCMVFPNDIDCLIKLLEYIKCNSIKYKVIGKGSNLVFNDNLYEGILINLLNFNEVSINGNNVVCGSGVSLVALCLKVARASLTGLEFASGIPGTVGGGIFMNAGAYNSDMGYVVTKIKVLTPDLKIRTMYNKELNFHYRDSFLKKFSDYICLEVTFRLRKGKCEAILDVIKERKERRIASQPLEYPSAGSVFRNPPSMFAGKLIEDVGLKGFSINGAKVSCKHANFIVNYNKATGADIRALVKKIQDEVYEKFDVLLMVEQEFVD